MGKEQLFQQTVLRKVDRERKEREKKREREKRKLNYYLIPYIKIYYKWHQRFEYKACFMCQALSYIT